MVVFSVPFFVLPLSVDYLVYYGPAYGDAVAAGGHQIINNALF